MISASAEAGTVSMQRRWIQAGGQRPLVGMWNMSPPPGSWREYRAEGGALAKGAGVRERDDMICYWHGRADIHTCGTPRQGHPGGGGSKSSGCKEMFLPGLLAGELPVGNFGAKAR